MTKEEWLKAIKELEDKFTNPVQNTLRCSSCNILCPGFTNEYQYVCADCVRNNAIKKTL